MIKTIDPKIPAVAADGTTPLEPEQMTEQLRVMRDHVPNFGPLPIPDAQALRTTANLPRGFLRASLNTIGGSKHISLALDATAPFWSGTTAFDRSSVTRATRRPG